MRLLMLLLLLVPSEAATLFRVACGGSGGTDAAGNLWLPDASYAGGLPWSVNPAGLVAPHKNLRFSDAGASFSYTFPVGAGSYRVRLLFVEPNKTAAGQRVYSVTINGAPVLVDLDLFAAAGTLKPYERSFLVTPALNMILVNFMPSIGNAVISGIEIEEIPPSPTLGAMASALGDLRVQYVDPTTLTIGAGCSRQFPCNYRIGNILYSITTGSTLTLTGAPSTGTGTLMVYLDNAGQLTATSGELQLACTAPCSALVGGGLFPSDSIPIWAWAVSGGVFTDNGTDQRVFLSR